MVITYFGGGTIRLQSGDRSLLVNPTNNRLKADVVVKSLTLADGLSVRGEIAYPGEYEIQGIAIRGFPLANESSAKFIKTVYAITWDEMRFAVLGHLARIPGPEIIEELGEPDVLFIPAGDDHFIGVADAAKLVRQLEPKVTIPVYYGSPAAFLKAFGQKADSEEKLVCKKKDLADSKGRIVVLEAKGSEKG